MLRGGRPRPHKLGAAAPDGNQLFNAGLRVAQPFLALQALAQRDGDRAGMVSPVSRANSPASRQVSSFLMLRLIADPKVDHDLHRLPYAAHRAHAAPTGGGVAAGGTSHARSFR